MKPGDHPDFFRFPAPAGTSRESSIRLDHEGRFWHDDALVDHPKLSDAMHSWITRHPEDGRVILSNGYDWTYFTVDTTPFFVVAVTLSGGGSAVMLTLSDGARVPLDPTHLREADDGALVAGIRHKSHRFDARFTRHAQAQLAPCLEENEAGVVGLKIGDRVYVPSECEQAADPSQPGPSNPSEPGVEGRPRAQRMEGPTDMPTTTPTTTRTEGPTQTPTQRAETPQRVER